MGPIGIQGLKGDKGDKGEEGAEGAPGFGFAQEGADFVARNPDGEVIFHSDSFDVFTDLLLIGTDKGRLLIDETGRVTLLSRRPEDDSTASSLHLNPDGSVNLGNSTNKLLVDPAGTMSVLKDTLVTNLNADQLDGKDASDFGTGFVTDDSTGGLTLNAPDDPLTVKGDGFELEIEGKTAISVNDFGTSLQRGDSHFTAFGFLGLTAATRNDQGGETGLWTAGDGSSVGLGATGESGDERGLNVDVFGNTLINDLSIGDDRESSADIYKDPHSGDLVFENGDAEFVFAAHSFHVNAPVVEINGEPVLAGDVSLTDLAQDLRARLLPSSCPEGQFARFAGGVWNCAAVAGGGGGTASNLDCIQCVGSHELETNVKAFQYDPGSGVMEAGIGTDLRLGGTVTRFRSASSIGACIETATSSTCGSPSNGQLEVSQAANAPALLVERTTNSSVPTAAFVGTTDGPAIRAVGNIVATGTKEFRIPHPLQPGKELRHAAIEAPQPLNVYSGNVRTDRRGFAVVRLPAYFDAINRDFRYQLTVVGRSFARAIVWKEIAGNRFTIRTDEPRVKVSWQVTAQRDDAYMRAHPFRAERPKAR